MADCKNCGRAPTANENYCSNCGTPLPMASAVPTPNTTNNQGNSNQNMLIGIIAILTLGLISVVIAVLIRPNPVPAITVTTPPNINPTTPALQTMSTPSVASPIPSSEPKETKKEIKVEENTSRPSRIRLSKADDNLDITKIRDQIEERYNHISDSYNALDSAGIHAYYVKNWRYHDINGTIDKLSDSEEYFSHIFDPNNPKRIVSAKMTNTIRDVVPLADDMVSVRVSVKVSRTNAVGQSLTINVLQDDIWDIQTMQCVRTNVVSKSKG